MSNPFSSAYAWPAPAKLNLFLHVTGRRPDGYHQLQTLFQFIDLQDELYFRPRGDGLCERTTGPADIPERDDICVRAAQALSQESGCGLGADIRLIKRIPVGGGLGGGSSDAATTLVALNRLWNTGFTVDELATVGRRLGADVPVFVRGAASWAEGIGERLSPVALDEPWYLLLVPPVNVSTREIFTAPELCRHHSPVTMDDFGAGRTGNDCEPVTCARHPQVAESLAWLRQKNPRATMSGTGATVFAAFPEAAQAQQLAASAPASWRTFVVRGLNRSPLADIIHGL